MKRLTTVLTVLLVTIVFVMTTPAMAQEENIGFQVIDPIKGTRVVYGSPGLRSHTTSSNLPPVEQTSFGTVLADGADPNTWSYGFLTGTIKNGVWTNVFALFGGYDDDIKPFGYITLYEVTNGYRRFMRSIRPGWFYGRTLSDVGYVADDLFVERDFYAGSYRKWGWKTYDIVFPIGWRVWWGDRFNVYVPAYDLWPEDATYIDDGKTVQVIYKGRNLAKIFEEGIVIIDGEDGENYGATITVEEYGRFRATVNIPAKNYEDGWHRTTLLTGFCGKGLCKESFDNYYPPARIAGGGGGGKG